MATAPTIAKNQDRVFKKIMSVIHGTSNEADKAIGHAHVGRIARRVWTCAEAPTATAAGLSAGDLVLDYTNDEVYRYISSTTFVNMTADS